MNKSDEYQTPKKYVEAAKLVMGTIDLDPATNYINYFRLKKLVDVGYCEEEADGLYERWFGNVWLNPPYSKPLLQEFTKKLLFEFSAQNISQAILLIPSHTAAYQLCKFLNEPYNASICFTNKRIPFLINGVVQPAPRFSNVFVYFGSRQEQFKEVFKQFGCLIKSL